jgi:peroxisomal coenzyme A diphosphatase NUDT7
MDSDCNSRYDNNYSSDDALNRLRNVNLTPKDQEQHKTLVRASVLVPLFLHTEESNDNGSSTSTTQWHVLLTKRLDSMRTHSGDVCFPGGKQDPEDENDDVATALRETCEEVGIKINHVTPICRLGTLESITGLCVTPIVGLIHPDANVMDVSNLNICTDEVEVAFTVPLQFFLDDNNLTSKHDVEWRGGTFELRTYHYTTVGPNYQTFKIWGLTAYIVHQVAMLAYP